MGVIDCSPALEVMHVTTGKLVNLVPRLPFFLSESKPPPSWHMEAAVASCIWVYFFLAYPWVRPLVRSSHQRASSPGQQRRVVNGLSMTPGKSIHWACTGIRVHRHAFLRFENTFFFHSVEPASFPPPSFLHWTQPEWCCIE